LLHKKYFGELGELEKELNICLVVGLVESDGQVACKLC